MHVDGSGGGYQDDDESRGVNRFKVRPELSSSGEKQRENFAFSNPRTSDVERPALSCGHAPDETCSTCTPRGGPEDTKRSNKWMKQRRGRDSRALASPACLGLSRLRQKSSAK